MNGDSFVELDLRQLLQFHHAHGGVATMAVVPVENAGRYGTVYVDSNNRITEFMEKTGANALGLINAGVYIFSSAILECIPDGPVSLEKEVFPRLLDRGVYALREQGVFIDIGTPADYAKAQQLFDRLRRATTPNVAMRSSMEVQNGEIPGEAMEPAGHFEVQVRQSIEASIAVKKQLLADARLVATVASQKS